MRILGIDPGLQRTGYGLIDVTATGRATIVEAGVIRADARKPLENRVREIYDGLSSVFAEFRPDIAVVEELFSTYGHPKTAILMGHARGVIFLAAAQAEVPVTSYAPNRIKQSVTNSGHADKRQVQRAVMQAFALTQPPQPVDVSDALAIALCHARMIGSPLARQLGAATTRRRKG
jgi:crossover junction endodeoxyribonuclease RuvC